MERSKLTYIGTDYGGPQNPRRTLILTLGYLSRYYDSHPITTVPIGISEIIRMHEEGKGQFERFDPLNKFEWSLTGREISQCHKSGLWKQLAVDDQQLSSCALAPTLKALQPTHVLLWDRMKMRAFLHDHIIDSLSLPLLGDVPTGMFGFDDGTKCLLMGMGNPTKAFPWFEWHYKLNHFLSSRL